VAVGWQIAQTVFIVAASERSDSVWFPSVVEDWITVEIEETLQFVEGIRACSYLFRGLALAPYLSRSADLLEEPLFGGLLHRIPLLLFVLSMSLLICLHPVSLSPTPLPISTFRVPTCICSSIRILFSCCYLVFGI
jgi:hypothetical protein